MMDWLQRNPVFVLETAALIAFEIQKGRFVFFRGYVQTFDAFTVKFKLSGEKMNSG